MKLLTIITDISVRQMNQWMVVDRQVSYRITYRLDLINEIKEQLNTSNEFRNTQ